MKGVVWQSDKGFTKPSSKVPVQAVVPANSPNLDAFSGLWVTIWRLMRWQDYTLCKRGDEVILWNEDDDDRSERYTALAMARAAGLIVHYGAETAGLWPKDSALAMRCDIIDYHLAVTQPLPPTTWNGLPVVITEYELTPPPRKAEWETVVPTAKSAVSSFFAWGASPTEADVNRHQDIVVALGALNQGGGEDMPIDENDPVIVALKQQIADQTEGLRRVTEGHYNGAGGSAAIVLALEGKNPPDPISPQPDVPNA